MHFSWLTSIRSSEITMNSSVGGLLESLSSEKKNECHNCFDINSGDVEFFCYRKILFTKSLQN